MDEYYTPEQLKQRFAEVGAQTPAEEIQAIERQWSALLREVRASSGLDPASPRAQELLRRWDALWAETSKGYQGDPKMLATIARNYEQGAYADNPDAPSAEDFAFIARAREATEQ